DEIGTGGNVAKLIANGIVGVCGIPDRPDRAVRGTQSPERCALNTKPLAGAQFVVSRNAIKHPDLMRKVLLVFVGIMRIQRGSIEFDISSRFVGMQQRFLNAELFGVPR